MLDYSADAAGIAAVAGLLAAYVMAVLVERRLGGVFSGFWYPKQKDLRNGLKQARQLAKKPARESIELRAVRSA